jgi:hypothetical protein
MYKDSGSYYFLADQTSGMWVLEQVGVDVWGEIDRGVVRLQINKDIEIRPHVRIGRQNISVNV